MDCCFLTFIAPLLVTLITLGGVALWERPPHTPRGVGLYGAIGLLSFVCAVLLAGYWFEPMFRSARAHPYSALFSKICADHPEKLIIVFVLCYLAAAMGLKLLLGRPYQDDDA